MMFTMSNGNIYNEMMDDMYNKMVIIFTLRYDNEMIMICMMKQ